MIVIRKVVIRKSVIYPSPFITIAKCKMTSTNAVRATLVIYLLLVDV